MAEERSPEEQIEELQIAVSERNQDLYLLRKKVEAQADDYSTLARAVGWTKELGTKRGESPVDVAIGLVRDIGDLKQKIEQLNADLREAILDRDATKSLCLEYESAKLKKG